MNVACSSCPAKYAVPDEKVRGRKVRITCKRCGAAIIVDGAALETAGPGSVAAGSPTSPTSERKRQATILGGLHAPLNSAPGAPVSEPPPPANRPAGVVVPKAAAAPADARAAAALPRAATAAKPGAANAEPAPKAAAAAVAPVEPPWTVAVTDDDHRDMSTDEVVAAYAAGTIDADTFIWKEGMDDWLTPFEIPAIADPLKAKGFSADAPGGGAGEEPPPSGWHEPGRWDGGKEPKGDVTFDDVTVAMEAPKAQALLDATVPAAAHDDPTAVGPGNLGFDGGDEPGAPSPAPAKAAASPLPLGAAARPAAGSPAPRPAAGAPAPRPAAGAPAAAAAQREERAEKPDLFAPKALEEAEPPSRARMPSIPPEPPASAQGSLTGARNESSVLFSLDQLVGKPKPGAKKKAPPVVEKIDEAALLMGGGPPPPTGDDAPPSIARFGDGTFFGGTAMTSAPMVAPDFTAPMPPSAPMNPTPSSPAPSPSQAPAQKKSSGGLWMGVAAVTILGGAAAFFVFRPSPAAPTPAAEPPPAATPAATEPTQAVPAATPPPAEPVASGAPAPSAAAPAPSAGGAAEAPAAASAPAAPGTPAGAVPGQPAAVTPPPAVPGAVPAPAVPGQPKPAAPAQPKPAAPPVAAPPAAAEGPEFDRAAASAALATAAAAAQGECASQDGTHGSGKVTVTFVNSGRATNALVSGDFAGSALGGCIARVFRSAKVPPFGGDSVRVTKGVRIP